MSTLPSSKPLPGFVTTLQNILLGFCGCPYPVYFTCKYKSTFSPLISMLSHLSSHCSRVILQFLLNTVLLHGHTPKNLRILSLAGRYWNNVQVLVVVNNYKMGALVYICVHVWWVVPQNISYSLCARKISYRRSPERLECSPLCP